MKISIASRALIILSSATSALAGINSIRNMVDDAVICTVRKLMYRPYVSTEPERAPRVVCQTDDGTYYTLVGDIDDFFGEDSYKPGSTMLSVPVSFISDDGKQIDLSADGAVDAISTRSNGSRGYEHLTGTWKTLVIRVTDSSSGTTPTVDSATLAADVFSDSLNLRSQYLACSNNQLTFDPATGSAVTNGVYDISVPFNDATVDSDGTNWEGIGTLVDAALPSTGIDSYTFKIYVLASTTLNMNFAVANQPGTQSWYNDGLGSDPPFLIHEIGHNLGFAHSSNTLAGNGEYGDATCVMGGADYSTTNDDQGNQCFNAAKTYFTGWYSAYYENITPTTTAYTGELVPTNDVASGSITSSEDYVIKVSDSGETDLYIFYNYATGIIADMDENFRATLGNHVVIYQQGSISDTSEVLGGLTTGGTYTKADWSGTGNSLKVEVCSITAGTPNKAKIIIYLDGVTTASCSATTSAPTKAPTASPVATTSAPTKAPTASPVATTSAPVATTSAPTKAPTASPVATTSAPTASPVVTTSAPTASPVVTTSAPTKTPSASCDDSGTRFILNGKPRTCEWVGRKASKKALRCGKKGVSSHCPGTCGACDEYQCADSTKRFIFNQHSKSPDRLCEFVGKKASKISKRCGYSGVASTCRATCSYCGGL